MSVEVKRKPLLSTNNAKTIKGEKLGYLTYILYMSPFKANSLGKNVCSHASKGCADSCLVGSGNGGMFPKVMQGRINKTEYFLRNRIEFLNQLREEIAKAIKKNEGKAIVTIRLNGTSDIPYENFRVFEDNKNIFELFPNIQFYDYTKNHLRFDKELPSNYHLTFSRSETNEVKAMELLARGFNVAMVFTKLPETYKGYKVINADENDLRFLDEKNVICGLKFKKLTGKGCAEKNKQAITSGFVINTINIGEVISKYNKAMDKVVKKRSKVLA
jgi:hypothetical protein